MSKSITSLVSFNGGQVAQTLTARVDQAKYRSMCLSLLNMMCLKTGPCTRRPGTQYIASTKYSDDANLCARLKRFVFSPETTFMLEWGNHYVRFYSNGAQVQVTSAPAWSSGSAVYHVNDYVTYSGQFYRCIADVSLSATPPPSDPASWVQQSILELYTPYTADLVAAGGDKRLTEVFQLQFAQINDVVYVVHKDHPRWVLTRITNESWTMKEVVEMVPPLLDQNATNVTIASSATTGTTTLTCAAPAWAAATFYERGDVVNVAPLTFYQAQEPHISGGTFGPDLASGLWKVFTVFQSGHVGSYWELANLRPSAFVEYDGVAATGFAAGESATITVYGDWEVRTYGVWSANIEVQGSQDGGLTWRKLRVISGRSDRNANISGRASVSTLMKLVINNVAVPVAPGATDPRVVLEAVDGFLYGVVKITHVTTAYSATAQVITQLPVANAWVSGQDYFVGDRVGFDGINYVCIADVSSATDPSADPSNWSADGWPTEFWSEGAWSAVRGYPRAITTFQQRVFCGFTTYEPQRVWGTKIGDIENWDLGESLADEGMAFDLDAAGDGIGVWLAAQDGLFAGLESAEWAIASSDATQALGPTSISARRQSKWGSNSHIAAEVAGDALIFIDRQGFSARQMLFSIMTSKYMSQDLTVLSEDILNQGAIQLAYARQIQKNGFLWVTTVSGELAAMTYEMDQEVFGWHIHNTDGDSFESVDVIPGADDQDDEVWVVVSRIANGGNPGTRFVERINPDNWMRDEDKDRAYYVDCGKTYANPVSNVFTGLDHLNGRTVVVAIDAQYYGDFSVSGGQITVDKYTPDGERYAHVGLPYPSQVQPMVLQVDERAGVTKGMMKKFARCVFDLYQTLECGYREAGGRGRNIEFTDPSDPTGVPQLFSGEKDVRDFSGDYRLDPSIIVYTQTPLPLSVRSLTLMYGIAGTP
jgi:hypothetical protein